jgi:hypothetical protein
MKARFRSQMLISIEVLWGSANDLGPTRCLILNSRSCAFSLAEVIQSQLL